MKTLNTLIIFTIILTGYQTTSQDSERPPLYYAAERGNVDLVQSLISSGVDSDLTNDVGETPLLVVGMRGSVEVAQMLLGKRADPNQAGAYGITPLHAAANWPC